MRLPRSILPFCRPGWRLCLLLFVCGRLLAEGQVTGGNDELAWLEKELAGLKAQGKFAEAIPVAQKVLAFAESTHGSNSWQAARCLNDLGVLHSETGDLAQAEPLHLRALAIQEQTRGADHPDTAGTLNHLALLYTEQAQFAKAGETFNRAMKITEVALGTDHADVAAILNNFAVLYQKTGDATNALACYERALAIREKRLGPEHPDTAQSLNSLGSLHRSLSRFETATAMFERVLAINQKALGPGHRETAATVFNLATLYQSRGDYAQAETNFLRAVTLTEQAWGSAHANTAEAFRSLGLFYLETGRYPLAETNLNRALAIAVSREETEPLAATAILNNLARLYKRMGDYPRSEAMSLAVLGKQERFFGTNHVNLAGTLNGLGLLYRETGDFDRAEAALTRALDLKERNLPPEHRSLALSLNNLALLYHDKGDFARAEAMYQRDLAISEKVLGPSHPETLSTVNNLASLYVALRDYARAEPLFRRVLEARETNARTDAASVADALNNLAGVHHQTGRYDQAGPLYERALQIRLDTFGTNHAATAQSLQNLGMLHARRRTFDQAAPLVQRALGIRENLFGPNHPDVANSLENLADIEQHRGNPAPAEAHLDRALGIYTNLFGPIHPHVADCFTALARLKIESHQTNEALAFAVRAAEVQEKTLANVLSFTSERQRLAYQERSDPYALFATLGSARLLAQALFHNKGIVLDSLLEDRQLAASVTNVQARELNRQLRQAKQLLSPLLLAGSRDNSPDAVERRNVEREKLTAQVERIEAALARQFVGLGQARRALSVEVEQVRQALPPRSALVEFVRYEHYFGADRTEPRYGAVVLTAAGEPVWVGLGAAAAIERNIRLFQSLMRGNADDAELERVLQSLHRQVWSPLSSVLPRRTKTVVLSPDAELNFVSFATLLNPANQFLASEFSIRYVASGRDLPPGTAGTNSSRSLVICANPDFGAGVNLVTPTEAALAGLRSGESRELRGLTFRPLPGAENEARQLQARSGSLGFREVVVHLGKAATETELNRVASPFVLHLATHGFFLPGPGSTQSRSSGGIEPGNTTILPSFQANPMQRSGLALAGAQRTLAAWASGQTPAATDDGILTAEEVGCLDLRNTWLVVVSACDTGAGEARAGEGVLGLRRGFLQAGAQNLLLTLWPIDDQQTTRLVLDFYAAAFKTGNAPLALASVQKDRLVLLRKEKGLTAACRVAGPFMLSFQGTTPE